MPTHASVTPGNKAADSEREVISLIILEKKKLRACFKKYKLLHNTHLIESYVLQ